MLTSHRPVGGPGTRGTLGLPPSAGCLAVTAAQAGNGVRGRAMRRLCPHVHRHHVYVVLLSEGVCNEPSFRRANPVTM